MPALLSRIVVFIGHALAVALGTSSLLYILLLVFGYAFGYGHVLGLIGWLAVAFLLPLVAMLLLICCAATKFKHVWWLGSIGLFAITCLVMFRLKDVGCWVYLKMNHAHLEQAVEQFRTAGTFDDFAVSPDGAYCLGISPALAAEKRPLLKSLHADVVIRHHNCILFSVEGMMTWHRGVLYSLDGNPPPEDGGLYYYTIATTPVGNGWYVYETGK